MKKKDKTYLCSWYTKLSGAPSQSSKTYFPEEVRCRDASVSLYSMYVYLDMYFFPDVRIRAMRDSPLLLGLKKIYIPNNPSLDLSSALFLASGSSLNMVQIDGHATSDRQFLCPIPVFIVYQITWIIAPLSTWSRTKCVFGIYISFYKASKP
jgi:hypothetical protein